MSMPLGLYSADMGTLLRNEVVATAIEPACVSYEARMRADLSLI